MNQRIRVDSIGIVKIDTALNLFQAESLIGITVRGIIFKSPRFDYPETIDYFSKLDFVEISNNDNKTIRVELVPELRFSVSKSIKRKQSKSQVYYQKESEGTRFEFYVEKRIITPGFGRYSVDVLCGQKEQSFSLMRNK